MHLRKLLSISAFLAVAAGAAWAQQAPACGPFPSNASELVCACTGAESGSVWGSGPYTADSNICVAARHAGAIGARGGEVRAVARPGQESYPGSNANGVTTSSWGRYGASFEFAAQVAACGSFPTGAAEHRCACRGNETGAVWGSGPYTSDSNICVAARHAGAVGPNGGVVNVYGAPGQASYAGTSANGVTTSNWGSYGSSFGFIPASASAGVPACGAYPGGPGPYECACRGNESGSVWGSGPYTSDSNLCVAARHAGAIGPNGGTVRVLGVGGLAAYTGSEANGVRTANWGSYGSSVIFNRN